MITQRISNASIVQFVAGFLCVALFGFSTATAIKCFQCGPPACPHKLGDPEHCEPRNETHYCVKSAVKEFGKLETIQRSCIQKLPDGVSLETSMKCTTAPSFIYAGSNDRLCSKFCDTDGCNTAHSSLQYYEQWTLLISSMTVLTVLRT